MAQLSLAFRMGFIERIAFFSIREIALSERLLIHSDVQTFSGSGAVAQAERDMAVKAVRSKVLK